MAGFLAFFFSYNFSETRELDPPFRDIDLARACHWQFLHCDIYLFKIRSKRTKRRLIAVIGTGFSSSKDTLKVVSHWFTLQPPCFGFILKVFALQMPWACVE